MVEHRRGRPKASSPRVIPVLGMTWVLLLSGCMMPPGTPPAPTPSERPARPDEEAAVAVRVDSTQSLVVMEAGPFDVLPTSSGQQLPGGHAAHE